MLWKTDLFGRLSAAQGAPMRFCTACAWGLSRLLKKRYHVTGAARLQHVQDIDLQGFLLAELLDFKSGFKICFPTAMGITPATTPM